MDNPVQLSVATNVACGRERLQKIANEIDARINMARRMAELQVEHLAQLRRKLYEEAEAEIISALRPNPLSLVPFRDRLTVLRALLSCSRQFHGALKTRTLMELGKALAVLEADQFDTLRAEELLINKRSPLELFKAQLEPIMIYAYVEAMADLETCVRSHNGIITSD